MVSLTSADEAVEYAGKVRGMLDGSMERLDMIDRYLSGDQTKPYTPPEANREYRQLVDKSITNWLQLVLAAPAQAMYVDGYRATGQGENARPWRWWQANGLDARQSAVYRAAMGYGVAYVVVRSGVDPMSGETAPQIRGVSPRRAIAAYEDPHDDWPAVALVMRGQDEKEWTADLYDSENVWQIRSVKGQTGKWTVSAVGPPEPHGASVVPVVRFADMPDLEGRHPGMIEPLIPIQDRINQTAFDLLMTQTFASFKVRWVSGMTIIPEHDDQSDVGAVLSEEQLRQARAAKLVIGQDRIITAEDPDTKFGQLDESPLSPFVEAQEANVRHLAAISQTPPHHLLGQMANLSAEALVAAETSLSRKVEERQTGFGESWEQVLRLAAQIADDVEASLDVSAEVKWRDHEARSFSATVDALGKAAQMLGVPVRGLWERIPGVTDQEISHWQQLSEEDDSVQRLLDELDRQAVGGN